MQLLPVTRPGFSLSSTAPPDPTRRFRLHGSDPAFSSRRAVKRSLAVSASDALSLVGRRLGRFRILSRLGQGGLATVWRAHDELLGRDVAIKVLKDSIANDSKVRRRFIHEAQAASLLEHPGIVTVFDAGESDGQAFIALTLIDGETVSDLAGRRLLPIDEAVRIVAAAADALSHAHARGVIHRDVSGRNVMVASDGRVYVLDFGLALAVGLSRVSTSETALGTMAYMAPEALGGIANLDARADVYGLGVLLFEALTGAYPHPGDRSQQLEYGKLNLAARLPSELRPEVPPQLDYIVEHALARDPTERYPSMDAMLRDLRIYAQGSGVPVPEERRHPAPMLRRVPLDPRLETQVTIPDPTFLAILPFKAVGDTGTEGAEQFLATRLAAAITAALGAEMRVRVVTVSAADALRWEAEPEREWAESVGANLVLSGQVARVGARMRVSYSIRDPGRGVQVGSGVTDGSETHAFDLEDAASASVRGALGVPTRTGTPTAGSHPPDPAAAERYALAMRYLERHDTVASLDAAISLLDRLVASEGERPHLLAGLARAFVCKARLTRERSWEAKAASAAQRAAALGEGDPEVQLAIGDVLWASDRHEQAVDHYDRVLADRPDCIEAMIGKARTLGALGRVEESFEWAKAATLKGAADWRSWNALGKIYFDRGDYDGAEAAWRRVIDITPDNPTGRNNHGSALLHLGRLGEAVDCYRESIRMRPNAHAYSNLGTALFFEKQYEEAVNWFEKAVQMSPDDPLAWGNLADACRWIPGRESQARSALERSVLLQRDLIARNPGRAESWARLGSHLSNLGDHEQSLAALSEARRLSPDDPQILVFSAHAALAADDREAALHWVREAVRHGFVARLLTLGPALASLHEDPELRRILNSPPGEDGAPRNGSA